MTYMEDHDLYLKLNATAHQMLRLKIVKAMGTLNTKTDWLTKD